MIAGDIGSISFSGNNDGSFRATNGLAREIAMTYRIIVGVIPAVVTDAIGRGIVLAFELDSWASSMIISFVTWPGSEGLAWILGGCFGLLCLIAWEMFRVDERSVRQETGMKNAWGECIDHLTNLPP
jgi:hypothetical protein